MNDLVARVEAAGYRSWPAREVVDYRGWQLRFADGFSRRANSVLPVGSPPSDIDDVLRRCAEWFAARGLELVVRMTPLASDSLDRTLERRGYRREGEIYVMVCDVDPGSIPTQPVAEQPSWAWWQAMADLWQIGDERQTAWRGIIGRIGLPAGYGAVTSGTDVSAAGLAVLDAPWLGLFEIIVGRTIRRQGVGTQLTRSLIEWGVFRGARHAYLQVVAENETAIAFYENLGFRRLYRYWYRRAPANRPGSL